MYNCIYHSFNIYNTVGTAFIYMWENALNSERGEQETHTIRIPTDNSTETLCFCYVVFWLRRAKLLCFCNLLHVLLPYGLRSDSPIWIMTLKCRCNFMLVKLWILHKFEWFRLTVPMLFIINCKKCINWNQHYRFFGNKRRYNLSAFALSKISLIYKMLFRNA